MDTSAIIFQRRSIRSFTSQILKREDIEAILEAGIWAPSGGNCQPWLFIVVTDAQDIQDMKALAPGLIGVPPALVVVCVNLNQASPGDGTSKSSELVALCDVSMASQNMMLSAWSVGIGSCVVKSFSQTGVANYLDIPEGIRPELLISFGYADHVPKPPKRFSLSDVVRWK